MSRSTTRPTGPGGRWCAASRGGASSAASPAPVTTTRAPASSAAVLADRSATAAANASEAVVNDGPGGSPDRNEGEGRGGNDRHLVDVGGLLRDRRRDARDG